ncbi:hypothetical protein BABINDRAFT_159278 [Babjeviella inositovora NRRL Y-12698]|uniref:Kinesin motor domain-containing protein n=1 Tax=Babjeviella inositovora NRRL Y-12698 TaxID=984486 RepID=A0A1E3QYS5_9ASCO|nr:uncharacterized protein BABINDRAFT_159278 [Babjeviella inositovora NRRL Y-12698]ODQ82765.1 hypothetical protein BABINDRAFT_159278 [Babjeviella inositovora NRRL Y-12698]
MDISLYLRVKPSPEGGDPIFRTTNDDLILGDSQEKYAFEKIFRGPASQDNVYQNTVANLVRKVLTQREDACFVAMGPSNSGKSYSMFGTTAEPGICFQSLRDIFTHQEGSLDRLMVSLSMFELHNDFIRDLFTNEITPKTNREIYTGPDHKIRCNVSKKVAESYAESVELVRRGLVHRSMAATATNPYSSRSHCFIQIDHVRFNPGPSTNFRHSDSVIFEKHPVSPPSSIARLTIADLAGNERTKLAETYGTTLKEGAYTNTTLSELGRVLEMASTRRRVSAPAIRNSKLTRLLFTDLVNPLVRSSLALMVNLDPQGDVSTVSQCLRFIWPLKCLGALARLPSASCETPIPVDPSSAGKIVEAELRVTELENTRLLAECVQLRAENTLLREENILFESRLLDLERVTRINVGEHYDLLIERLKNEYESHRFKQEDNYTKESDKKLELLSKYYEKKLADMGEEHERLEGELEEAKGEMEVLVLDKQIVAEEVDYYKLKLGFTADELASLGEKHGKLEAEAAEVVAKYDTLKSSIEELTVFKEKYGPLHDKHEALTMAYETMVKAQVKERNAKLDSEARMIQALGDSRRESSELKRKLESQDANLKSIQAELDELKNSEVKGANSETVTSPSKKDNESVQKPVQWKVAKFKRPTEAQAMEHLDNYPKDKRAIAKLILAEAKENISPANAASVLKHQRDPSSSDKHGSKKRVLARKRGNSKNEKDI